MTRLPVLIRIRVRKPETLFRLRLVPRKVRWGMVVMDYLSTLKKSQSPILAD